MITNFPKNTACFAHLSKRGDVCALLKGARWILSPKPRGLKRSDSRWKAWDVRKMLGPAETERGSDRDGWSGREGCAFLSVFTLYVHLYLYHFVYLYLDSHTAPDFFGAHSHWWSLRKRKRERSKGKKKKESKKEQDSLGLYCRDPLPSVRCLLSASLTARPLRETTHTHTQLKDIYVFGTYTPERVHAARTAACCFFSKVGCDNLDHLLHSDEPPSLKIKGGREEERKRGGWIGRREQRMLLCCQQKHCFMDAVFTVVLPYCVCVCVCVCQPMRVCLFAPLDVFGLTCPQGWIKPVKVLLVCVCVCVCVWCSEMY